MYIACLNHRIECNHMVPIFVLVITSRRSLLTDLLNEPFARLNKVKGRIFARVPRSSYLLLQHNPDADASHRVPFRRDALEYTSTLSSYK